MIRELFELEYTGPGTQLSGCVLSAADDAGLQRPELRLAIGLEQLRDRHARDQLDLVVGIVEGQVEKCRDPASDRGLAGAHQADEGDGTRAQAVLDGGLGLFIEASLKAGL